MIYRLVYAVARSLCLLLAVLLHCLLGLALLGHYFLKSLFLIIAFKMVSFILQIDKFKEELKTFLFTQC